MEKDPLSRHVLGWMVVLGALLGSIGIIGVGIFSVADRLRNGSMRKRAPRRSRPDGLRSVTTLNSMEAAAMGCLFLPAVMDMMGPTRVMTEKADAVAALARSQPAMLDLAKGPQAMREVASNVT